MLILYAFMFTFFHCFSFSLFYIFHSLMKNLFSLS